MIIKTKSVDNVDINMNFLIKEVKMEILGVIKTKEEKENEGKIKKIRII